MRILSKQDKLQPLGYTFSPPRGSQVQWLISDAWNEGMPDNIRKDFEQKMQSAVEKWRKGLSGAQEAVCIAWSF